MGLDIGVIPTQIKYLGRPEKEVYDFVWHLELHADDEETWRVSSNMSTIVEYSREAMSLQVDEYTKDEDVTEEAIAKIRSWVDELPWDDDHIMLHFSW